MQWKWTVILNVRSAQTHIDYRHTFYLFKHHLKSSVIIVWTFSCCVSSTVSTHTPFFSSGIFHAAIQDLRFSRPILPFLHLQTLHIQPCPSHHAHPDRTLSILPAWTSPAWTSPLPSRTWPQINTLSLPVCPARTARPARILEQGIRAPSRSSEAIRQEWVYLVIRNTKRWRRWRKAIKLIKLTRNINIWNMAR